MDMGRDATAGFFQGSLLPVLLTSGALSDPVLFDAVVQHWLLAINCDRIAFGLLFESPLVCTSCFLLSYVIMLFITGFCSLKGFLVVRSL